MPYPPKWSGFYKRGWSGGVTSSGAAAYSNTKSLIFDGIDEYVTLGSNAALRTDARTQARSFAFWMKLTNYTGYNTAFSEQGAGGKGATCYTEIVAGNLNFGFRAGAPGAGGAVLVRTNAAIGTGSWAHIALTYSGSGAAAGLTVYKNGSAVAVTAILDALTADTTSSDAFVYGATPGPSSLFVGSIDEVVISNVGVEFSAANVTSLYNGGTGVDVSTLSFVGNILCWYRNGDHASDAYPTIVNALTPGTYNGTMTNMEAGDIQSDAP